MDIVKLILPLSCLLPPFLPTTFSFSLFVSLQFMHSLPYSFRMGNLFSYSFVFMQACRYTTKWRTFSFHTCHGSRS